MTLQRNPDPSGNRPPPPPAPPLPRSITPALVPLSNKGILRIGDVWIVAAHVVTFYPFLAEGTTVVFATGAQTNVSIPPERFAEALSLAMVRQEL